MKEWSCRAWRLFIAVSAVLLIGAGCTRSTVAPQDEGTAHQPHPVLTASLEGATTSGHVFSPSVERLPPDIRAIRERGQLVVAMTVEDQFPFYYVDNEGRFIGADVSLATDIARRLGVEVVFNRTATTFNETVELVATGEADVAISKLSVTLPRAQQVLYTRPYVHLRQTVLVNRKAVVAGRAGTDDLVVLNGPVHKIGVLSGSSYVDFAEKLFPRATLVSATDVQSLMEAVVKGDLSAVLYDEPEIKGFVQARPEVLLFADMQLLDDQLDPIAIAVPWQSHWLQQWLNQYLEVNDIRWTVDELLEIYERPGGE